MRSLPCDNDEAATLLAALALHIENPVTPILVAPKHVCTGRETHTRTFSHAPVGTGVRFIPTAVNSWVPPSRAARVAVTAPWTHTSAKQTHAMGPPACSRGSHVWTGSVGVCRGRFGYDFCCGLHLQLNNSMSSGLGHLKNL